MKEFWLIGTVKSGGKSLVNTINSCFKERGNHEFVYLLDVPSQMKYGRFDDLLDLIDDLNKFDLDLESTCKKMRRLVLEINKNAELNIMNNRNLYKIEDYLTKFSWDESKYPKSNLARINAESIIKNMKELEQQVSTKQAILLNLNEKTQYTDKMTISNSLNNLWNILTPSVIDPIESNFVYTKYLTTMLCVVPTNSKQEFIKNYEFFSDKVVPKSLFFICEDKTHSLCGVIMFKAVTQQFATKCKSYKVDTRNLEVNKELSMNYQFDHSNKEMEKKHLESLFYKLTTAVYSECFTGWIHIKIIKIYTECLLRYGINAHPTFIIFQLKNANREKVIHSQLSNLIGVSCSIQQFLNSNRVADEEYMYPYIQLSIKF